MLTFLEQNVSSFASKFKEELKQDPVGDLLVTARGTLGDDGRVYIDEADNPEFIEAIARLAAKICTNAVFAFIETYAEQVDGVSRPSPVESIDELRIRLDALEKRFNDTLPPTWLGQPPDGDIQN
jgi:hypothetical protein